MRWLARVSKTTQWFVVVAILLTACDSKSYFSTSMLPEDATRIEEVPPIWETWWAETEECLARFSETAQWREYPFKQIEWYSVKAGLGHRGESYSCPTGLCYAEATYLDDSRGTIHVSERRLEARTTITHEAIHVLTRGKMSHGHPAFCYCTLSDPDSMTEAQVDELCYQGELGYGM